MRIRTEGFERVLGGDAVEIDNPDRLAARLLAPDVHLRDVHPFIAERAADEADQARDGPDA